VPRLIRVLTDILRYSARLDRDRHAFPTRRSSDSTQWDVVIVGAGITGLTTGLQLQEAGKRCLILEAYTIGFGTTGGTTAHINTLLDTPYHTIEKDFGAENAQLVAQATHVARDLIASNVAAYGIDCD